MATSRRYTREAIEIMFAWNDRSDDADHALERLQWYVDDFGGDPTESLRKLMSGMINLCGKLLLMREEETGTSVAHTLTVLGVHSRTGNTGQ